MTTFLPHHAETLRRVTEHFQADPTVKALILGGSLAHGFATENSDVDVMMIVDDEDHEERLRTGRTCFFSRELCTYESGYVDGKFVSAGFLREVISRGSEPARYAFQDAKILFCRDESIPEMLRKVAEYPHAEKSSRLLRFQAQVEAWHWYSTEALKKQNLPLLRTSVSKLTLFSGRIVLAHNHLLYPYHKWFMRVLEGAPEKPSGFMQKLYTLAQAPTLTAIEELGKTIRDFRGWEITHATWPAQFMQDSELNWLTQEAPIDDI